MKHTRKIFGGIAILLVASMMVWMPADFSAPANQAGQRLAAGATTTSQQDGPAVEQWIGEAVTPVLTQAARDLPPSEVVPTLDREVNPRMTFGPLPEKDFDPPNGPDPLLALQEAAPAASPDGFNTPIFNFAGQGYTFVNPPDTVGDVGKNHYIQMINGGSTQVAVYNKATGALIQQFSLSTLGGCATGNGDPIVLYDQLADRWFLSEFGPGNSLCTFVSQTPDPLGAYYSYQHS